MSPCMQMTWFCVVSQRRPEGDGGTVRKRRVLKVNKGKRNLMVMNGKEGLDSEVHVDGIHLEQVSEVKYLGCVLNESGTRWQVPLGL